MLPKSSMTLVEKMAIRAVLCLSIIPQDKLEWTFLQFIQQDHITPAQRESMKVLVNNINKMLELNKDVIAAHAAETESLRCEIENFIYHAEQPHNKGRELEIYQYKQLKEAVRK